MKARLAASIVVVPFSSMLPVMLTAAFSAPFSISFPTPAPDVMLVPAPVALDAVVVIADALFDMLTADLVERVLMAAVAGVTAIIVADMACHAARVVVAIQLKIPVVIKGRGRPSVLFMALTAIAGNLLVQGI